MTTSEESNAQQYVRLSDIAEEPQQMLMPISGYEEMPLVTLEKAVEPLVLMLPGIQYYVYVAKLRYKSVLGHGLTEDESAAIILYTMSWEPHEQCLYFVLNLTLRTEERENLKPWFLYLKLILTALSRLPSTRRSVFRGIKMNLAEQYPQGREFIWWGFSSCTPSIEALQKQQFLGNTGPRTLFFIDCDTGKDISRFSFYKSEEEIVLFPARRFRVQHYLQATSDVHIIKLKEIESSVCLLQPIRNESTLNQPSFGKKRNIIEMNRISLIY
jgi:hypothetical protein